MKLKYILSIFLILSVFGFCLAGCDSRVSDNDISENIGLNNTPQDEKNDTTQGEQSTDTQVEQPHNNDIIGVAHIYNKAAYDAFLNSEKRLPECFIKYEQLSCFGAFYGFVCDDPDFSAYAYALTADNGLTFTLRINHSKPKDNSSLSAISIGKLGTTMETLTTQDKGIITRDDVTYKYVAGQLISIKWESCGVYFTISRDSTWEHYPAFGSDSIMARILSSSESVSTAAMKEANDFISANRKNAKLFGEE